MAKINMFAVIIEWDGQIPPTLYYQRMHALELFVQARSAEERDMSPLKRRAIEDGSVIAQEGAVLCTSPSLARAVAQYAYDLGAEVVLTGRVQLDDYQVTPEDQEVMDKLENVFGRRGRPSKARQDWLVTCMEECHSYEVHDVRDITHCPYCSGLKVRFRDGIQDFYSVPDGDVFDAWMRHRFVHGSFEVPMSTSVDGTLLDEPPAKVVIKNKGDSAVVAMMRNSTEFMRIVRLLPRETALRILDAVCAARSELEKDARRVTRIETVVKLMEMRVDPTKLKLIEPINEVDLLDASAVLGPEFVSSLYLAMQNK